jgi:hypothetical protein
MNPRRLFASALVISGAAGLFFPGAARASDGTPHPGVIAKAESHYRIFMLKDRIKNQRERIDKGLAENTLTADEAKGDRDVIDDVAGRIKAEAKANGAKKTMSKDQYEAYNASLDANSAKIREERQFYYYYGPFADVGPDYSYYYDPFAGPSAAAPSKSAMEMKHPRILELKDRIKNQRARIDRGLNDGSLTGDDAKASRMVLDKLEARINAERKANGTKIMTKERYDSYNTDLDVNSAVLHEEKGNFYYYGPYYDRYSYWD